MTEAKQQQPIPTVVNLSSASSTSYLFSNLSKNNLETKLSPKQVCKRGLRALLIYNHVDALKLFQQAEKDHYLPATIFLGIMLQEGWAIKKDTERANFCFTQVFEKLIWFSPETQNDPFLLYCLGRLCWASDYQSINRKYAIDFFKQAADFGFAPALISLAYCYKYGRHTKKDELKANGYFRAAAVRGEIDALLDLGDQYLEGVGVSQDNRKAIAYYQRAAKYRHALAHFKLGVCYLKGILVPRSGKKAFQNFKDAMEKGYEHAQSYYAYCYINGIGVVEDLAKGVSLLQNRIETIADDLAFIFLGHCYMRGMGVTKDLKKGAELYKRAADMEDPEGQYYLGVSYLYGLGVPKNEVTAAKQFTLSAKAGFVTSQRWLADCYARGAGVAEDKTQAIYWLSLAAAWGDVFALNRFKSLAGIDYSKYSERRTSINNLLRQLLIFGTKNSDVQPLNTIVTDYLGGEETAEVEINCKEERAYFGFFSRSPKLYRLLADRGDVHAKYELGLCYLKGKGVELNRKEAVRYFHQAAKLGHKKAAKALDKLPTEKAALYEILGKLGFTAYSK